MQVTTCKYLGIYFDSQSQGVPSGVCLHTSESALALSAKAQGLSCGLKYLATVL